MKKIFNYKTLAILLALAFAISLSACAGAGPEDAEGAPGGNQDTGALTGTITVSGSMYVQPLLQELCEAFKAVEPGITVDIQGSSSEKGITDVTEGIADIGASSRELTEEEKNAGLTGSVIAYDGIAVVTHSSAAITNLTKEQIAKIFNGEIKNWKDAGGPDKEILVVSREEGSEIRDDFEDVLKLQETGDGKKVSLVRADALVMDGPGAVQAIISARDNAIGYTSMGSTDDSMKKISVEGAECTTSTLRDRSYPLSVPFLIVTRGDSKPEVQAFINYILGADGQKIVGENYGNAK